MARICIVDDDPDIRHLVTYALVDEGHEVSTCPDGAAAFEMLKEDPPDLMLLDIMMPGMDGYQVLEAMREAGLREATKVLILTAKGSERDWEQGFELGANVYMTKPFDPDELIVAVRELLAASEEELKTRREEEYDKAHLLSQLEAIFGSD